MSRTPKISIIITQHDWVGPHLRELDQTSLHALYIADHPSFTTTDSWSWLAYAAGQTERIRLGTHVTGKRLGIVGMGRIGQAVAKRCQQQPRQALTT